MSHDLTIEDHAWVRHHEQLGREIAISGTNELIPFIKARLDEEWVWRVRPDADKRPRGPARGTAQRQVAAGDGVTLGGESLRSELRGGTLFAQVLTSSGKSLSHASELTSSGGVCTVGGS